MLEDFYCENSVPVIIHSIHLWLVAISEPPGTYVTTSTIATQQKPNTFKYYRKTERRRGKTPERCANMSPSFLFAFNLTIVTELITAPCLKTHKTQLTMILSFLPLRSIFMWFLFTTIHLWLCIFLYFWTISSLRLTFLLTAGIGVVNSFRRSQT